MNTGQRIRELRLARGMTLEELGRRVGVGKSTVRKWETGAIANMRRDKIAALAEALGTGVDDILNPDASRGRQEAEDDFPEARLIARAGRKMTPERKADMMRLLQMMFPEEFADDGT